MTTDLANLSPAELDAVAAVEVMGWLDDGDLWHYVDETSLCQLSKSCWCPTESIADAFTLVAKMRERGLRFWLMPHDTVTAEFEWFPDDGEGVCREYSAIAETFPLAITRAAVLAVSGMAGK